MAASSSSASSLEGGGSGSSGITGGGGGGGHPSSASIAASSTLDLSSSGVENSVAFNLIDDLVASRKILPTEAADIKSRFARLFEAQSTMQDKEKSLTKRARGLTNEVLKERITLQEAKFQESEETVRLEGLESEKEAAQREYEEVESRDSLLKFQLSEVQQVHEELESQMQDMKLANENLVYPEVQKLRDRMMLLDKDLRKAGEDMDRENSIKKKLVKAEEELQAELVVVLAKQDDLREAFKAVEVEPTRVSKQVDVVIKAKHNMLDDLQKIKDKIAKCSAESEAQQKRKAEANEAKKNLLHKLELHRDTMEARQADLGNIRGSLAMEKDKHHQLTMRRVELDLARREVEEACRHCGDALSMSRKEYDALKRKVKTKRGIANAAREVLPGMAQSVVDNEHNLKMLVDDCKRNAKELEEHRAEVDEHIAKFLRAEGMEKEAADEFQKVVERMDGMEEELARWVLEERRLARNLGIMTAHREMKVREAARARRNESEAQEQLKSKELIIMDLTKKCSELNNKLKEYSALYDIVKNDRNKHVNQIQVSNQALAEMKEKIKILQNEIEILRNECKVKDRELAKEFASHQGAQVQRDALRYDTNKSQAEYKKKQEMVDQQIVEIDKLNSLINQLEKRMLVLKTSYERAVESRNLAGVQLIDRNDELCVLYEKANIQEQTLKQGEVSLQQREEELRLMRLKTAELVRQVEAAKKVVPQVKAHAAKISKLQEELAMEKTLTDRLCKDLEDPRNTDRWKALPGVIPDPEALLTKIEVLQERLDVKKEVVLEKELMLEEVTNLTVKLRNQALGRRDETLQLAKRASDFQSKIRGTTRQMMALVAELSMYQATALKLQQEKHLRLGELEMCRTRFEHGEAPSIEAEKELHRQERVEVEKDERLVAKERMDKQLAQPHAVHKTTAEPRPNAYVQEYLGVPKPYGGFAPFKPTETGSNMRHIRKPQEVEIEI